MTIRILYNEYTLFDIEYYITASEKTGWFTEINCCTCVKGITKFLQDKMSEIDVDKFIEDSEVIQEIRGWLWEMHQNTPVSMDECQHRHYHVFKPEFDKIVKEYCNKYNFFINTD